MKTLPLTPRGLPWLPWVLWTLWFLLDPALAPWAMTAPWALSQGLSLWAFGVLAILLGWAIFRRYGLAALVLSLLCVFLVLWGAADLVFSQTVVLPNPAQLLLPWQSPSQEAYALLLSWVQGWCICFALILGVGRLAAKRRLPNNP